MYYNSFKDFVIANKQNPDDFIPIFNPFSKWLWVYNNQMIANLQMFPNFTFKTKPNKFPILLLPKIDKHLSKNKYKLESMADFIDFYSSQHIIEYYWIYYNPIEPMFSIDILIENKKIKEKTIYINTPNTDIWEKYLYFPEIILKFINTYLINYEGYIELLLRGDTIIENIRLKRGFSVFKDYKTISVSEINDSLNATDVIEHYNVFYNLYKA